MPQEKTEPTKADRKGYFNDRCVSGCIPNMDMR